MSESEAVTTYGSGPEVMSDMADRIAMISAQTPKIIGWQIELYALHSTINAEDLQQTLKNISATSIKFQQLMQQSPEMMAGLALDMRNELAPLLTQLSDLADNKLEKLTQERSALEEMVSRERLAIEQIIIQERTAVAVNLDDIAKHSVEVVFNELRKTFKSIIVYIILLLLVVFFAPLMLGVWLGKRIVHKNK